MVKMSPIAYIYQGTVTEINWFLESVILPFVLYTSWLFLAHGCEHSRCQGPIIPGLEEGASGLQERVCARWEERAAASCITSKTSLSLAFLLKVCCALPPTLYPCHGPLPSIHPSPWCGRLPPPGLLTPGFRESFACSIREPRAAARHFPQINLSPHLSPRLTEWGSGDGLLISVGWGSFSCGRWSRH